ncbi:hypothetical protein AK812_SmicGene40367 [Symbiodinium microadriaticum]|uniref:Uncharacterized protein n=1 Tax=Symbiodinium microadriaticum TaxID=2951 RepID=A0A1Q9C8W7_SYMMI|nr:hypothetical protein AK812_SmicGene40367 [Symbiodinium microadriaticum]
MRSGPDVDSYREDKLNWTGGGLNVEPPKGCFALVGTEGLTSALQAVHVESEEEAKDSSTQSRGWVKKAALALALGFGIVGFMAMPKATILAYITAIREAAPRQKEDDLSNRRFCNGLDLGAFQGKSNLGLDAQMALKADALKGVKKPSAAEKIVLKAMKSTGRKYSKHFQQREVRALPADPADAAREMLTKDEIVAYKATRREQRMRKARGGGGALVAPKLFQAQQATNAYCAFNVLEVDLLQGFRKSGSMKSYLQKESGRN